MSSNPSEHSEISTPIPWKEMFESAASSPLMPHVPPSLTGSRSSPALGYVSRSIGGNPQGKETKKPILPPKEERKSSDMGSANAISEPSSAVTNMETAPGKICYVEDDQSANRNHDVSQSYSLNSFVSSNQTSDTSQQHFQLAIYIAMAHAVLIFLFFVLYGIWKLLECYRRPIQWAILCSMPLRAIHGTIVAFWETSLNQGLLGTLLAIPFAFCRALIVTTLDAKLAIMHLFGKCQTQEGRTVRFTTLMEWLFSFALMALAFEYMGAITLALVPFVVMTLYSFGASLGLVPEIKDLETETKRTLLSMEHSHRWEQARSWLGFIRLPITKLYKLVGIRITSAFLSNLHHLVAIFLMVLMIVGSLSGLLLFSYKIGHEGKDLVVALKSHVEKGNYIEKVGLKQWMEENNIPELIDTYAGKAYDTVSSQIDDYAAKYQMTELADAGKQYLLGFAQEQRRKILTNDSDPVSTNSYSNPLTPSHPALDRAQRLMQKIREYDVKGAYSEMQQSATLVMEHLNIPREELLERVKQAGERWLGLGKHVFANSSKLAFAIGRLLLAGINTILSGAPELIAFCADSFIFFSVLHYLVISKSGGVMEQVLSMFPLSDSTRTRCAVVLDHAVSSVLLATVKAAFFQAMFTWLLFRVLKIHFLYVCTLLAFSSAFLPIIPTWWSSVPAGIQLAIEGRYISAVLLVAAHMGLMDYGVSAIQSGIPGHNAYLTGLSIAGGMALFSSVIEGAIMGPLLMTVAISLKNLYTEFILSAAKLGA
ncbi:hypothetical protein KP509_07G026600 [Ceratopteris richardii]|uniref:Uncharacterized protein n=1 Tax=Ceratopteris richardii TaxID=49495 RepID=A0A8T2UGS2_CERRI|nr:hypothetical protein KP509_07G026600 [Ceratopteris richardii]KAH7432529.1 hypothetical protein KP509_07G026600 [Ceratopteris richardii]KAH7432530.1 hypothetical protein KP509_07G026600 [Ceratopteris richardii]KAH7432531.1 hypothetical protein KP509_07G026600 [Ceratopteris richardii]KAH7432532.1 hypothetical protein KP509_07G026600 [Ceratopteris richardii]